MVEPVLPLTVRLPVTLLLVTVVVDVLPLTRTFGKQLGERHQQPLALGVLNLLAGQLMRSPWQADRQVEEDTWTHVASHDAQG